LKNLQYLDLSGNQIEEVDVKAELPESLIFLKLRGNPIATSSSSLIAYRKPIVLGLPNLIELDKIEVLVAERLSYQGLLPRCNLENLLKKKED
jgi:Leucine-rich repeat (LRR) protein